MLSRIAIFIIAALILVIVIFVGYNFIKGVFNFHDKLITITSDNRFDPTSLSVSNIDNVKIKNNSNQKQIILDTDTGNTLAEVASKTTSKRLDLAENSKSNLTLSDYKDTQAVVTVGSLDTGSETPTETPNTTPTATPTPMPTSKPSKPATSSAVTGSNLPGTGTQDYLPLLLLVLGGLAVGRYAKIYRDSGRG